MLRYIMVAMTCGMCAGDSACYQVDRGKCEEGEGITDVLFARYKNSNYWLQYVKNVTVNTPARHSGLPCCGYRYRTFM